ncbi:FluC/FEX family fluoride channel [Timonella sp. A28]|uniref:FluC/FEX family fluoride channel n=1 Tax=Timonella sp. A28 TaxID=3442640 RepID=UPI003EBFB204
MRIARNTHDVKAAGFATPNAALIAVLVWIGGGTGALLRAVVQHVLEQTSGTATFSSVGVSALALLCVNVLGCYFIGVLAHIKFRARVQPYVQAGIVTGLLGGFTSFSTYLLLAGLMAQESLLLPALAYVIAAVVVCVAAVWLGRLTSSGLEKMRVTPEQELQR